MFWKGKRVLVTGGRGLMGEPMTARIINMGAAVIVYDIANGLDILNYDELVAMMKSTGADIVIHLAAISHVEHSREMGKHCFDVNATGTVNVLEAARECNVKAVVTASSNHVYGKQAILPVKEDASLNQLDTYSATKIMADVAARAYWHNYAVPTGVIRNTNCYGPGDPHLDHIVPGTVLSLLRGDRPIIRSDGTTRKGYLYVEDVVDAYLLVAEKLYTGEAAPGQAWNVGAEPISSYHLVEQIKKLMDVPQEATRIQGESNDQTDEDLDTTRIKVLGWAQRHTLADGLELTIKWFREQQVAV